MAVKCEVCLNNSKIILVKQLTENIIPYFQCGFCETIFSGSLPNGNMVGGGFEEQRNREQNETRIKRIFDFIYDLPNKNILDFGCGHGMLVEDIRKTGLSCDGYDKYNPEFNKLDEEKKYGFVTMVEVVEHLSYPFEELDFINERMVPGGVLYIETSFVDVAAEENIPLDEFFYINPEVGHSTIFSHFSLDLLMLIKGFIPLDHINRNARLYKKKLPYK